LKWLPAVLLFVSVRFAFALSAQAQTITVDASHPTNHFVPNQTLGAGVDRIAVEAIDKDLLQPTLEKTMASGWQPVTYRQNTELAVEAWHWNPQGTGATRAAKDTSPVRRLRRRSSVIPMAMRCRVADSRATTAPTTSGFSRLTDGDLNTFWKSNPYLTQRFTGESDTLHPQWVVLDLAQVQQSTAFASPGASLMPGATLCSTGRATIPSKRDTRSLADVSARCAHGWKRRDRNNSLERHSVPVRFVRIWMTESSNTCDADGPADPRNCVGYSIRELYLGTTTDDGEFHDVLRHTPDQEQTTTYCSSVDPWHRRRIWDRPSRRRWDLICSSPAASPADCPR
jgi:hypothetical protein